MKWLTTLLSLYLLGLALWPCADEFPAPAGSESHVVLSADAPNPGASHPHHDQCTPFCSCTCCAAAITVVPNFSYAPVLFIEPCRATVIRFNYELKHRADPLAAIWQPPKCRV